MTAGGIRSWRNGQAALVLLAGICFGAWREFAFINLNYQIDHVANHTRFSYAHSLVQGWTAGWGLPALLRLKWALALFSMAVVAGLCIILARVLFGSWRHRTMILAGFAGFAGFSLLLHALARWAPPLELVSVRVSHMLQYPVPLVFLLVASVVAAEKRA